VIYSFIFIKKILCLQLELHTIIFTERCISHYKIYLGQNGPNMFFLLRVIIDLHLETGKIRLSARGSLIFCKNKNKVLKNWDGSGTYLIGARSWHGCNTFHIFFFLLLLVILIEFIIRYSSSHPLIKANI